MGRQVQRYGDLARQLGMWVGIKEEVVPSQDRQFTTKDSELWLHGKWTTLCRVFPFIILLYLHRLVQLLEKALWPAKISTPPFVEECLVGLFQANWYIKHNELESRAGVSYNKGSCLVHVKQAGVGSFT